MKKQLNLKVYNDEDSMREAVDRIIDIIHTYPEAIADIYMAIEDMPKVAQYIVELGYKDKILLHDENDKK